MTQPERATSQQGSPARQRLNPRYCHWDLVPARRARHRCSHSV